MPVTELVGFPTGVSRAGVDFLQPTDSFTEILDGFIYLQVLQSRLGLAPFYDNRLQRTITAANLTQTTTAGLQTIIVDVLADAGVQNPTIRSIDADGEIVAGTVEISVDSASDTWDDSTTPGVLTARTGNAANGTIDYVSGEIVLNFIAPNAGGEDIEITFRYYPAERVMGIFEHVHPDGTKELLAADKHYLYSWDQPQGRFNAIPFSGTPTITSLGISNNYEYVSGTSYPTKAGAERFIFTSPGASNIFFYNGTNVLVLNSTNDADYAQPPEGAFTNAYAVIFFNGRLNFAAPLIGGRRYGQAIFYSGIANAAGNGDKFNVAGAGFLGADTYQEMRGPVISGDTIVAPYQRGNYAFEKTTDPFNPYRVRQIPGVLGADSSFGTVSWNYQTKYVGKTGFCTTDGRQQLRFDKKFPQFTADDMDATQFNLTYGGFDRVTSQFLWAYKSPEFDGLTQDSALCWNYEESTWSVLKYKISCYGQTDLGRELSWDEIDETINPSWERWDTTEEAWDLIGVDRETQKTLAGDDYGYIWYLNQDYDDYYSPITNLVVSASSSVATCTPSLTYSAGDRIYVEWVDVGGVDHSIYGDVLSVTDTSVTINLGETAFESYVSGGFLSKPIGFLAKTIPFNPYRSAGKRVYVSHVDVYLESDNTDLTLSVYVDGNEAPIPELKNIPLVAPSSTVNRQYISVSVNCEAEFVSLELSHTSATDQVRISSIRIYHDEGGQINA